MENRNRYLEALKENFNVVGLATAAALSAALLNPLPLLLGIVAEAAYLVFVPDSKWYDARLSARYDAAVQQRREDLKRQVLASLRPEMQARFKRMEVMRRDLDTLALDNQTWFREVLRKLDFLLEKFLHFASKEVQFRSYLLSVLAEVQAESDVPALNPGEDDAEILTIDNFMPRHPRQDELPPRSPRTRTQNAQTARRSRAIPITQGAVRQNTNQEAVNEPAVDRGLAQTVAAIQKYYDRELNQLRALHEAEQDIDTKSVLGKRIEVLQRRREFVGKIGKVLTNLNHQLLLLEDTFGLISDEIRARPPEQVLADIDDVVWQTKTMTELLEEMAPFEATLARSA